MSPTVSHFNFIFTLELFFLSENYNKISSCTARQPDKNLL